MSQPISAHEPDAGWFLSAQANRFRASFLEEVRDAVDKRLLLHGEHRRFAQEDPAPYETFLCNWGDPSLRART